MKEHNGSMKKLCGVLGILMLLALAAACGKSTTEKWQEQYDLGQQYLLEESYEEAIVAFTAAIEIEPNQADAYIGRGPVRRRSIWRRPWRIIVRYWSWMRRMCPLILESRTSISVREIMMQP